MDFDGKRCIVTGAAMGIGRAVAEELLERGAKCIIADINWKVSDTQCNGNGHLQKYISTIKIIISGSNSILVGSLIRPKM